MQGPMQMPEIKKREIKIEKPKGTDAPFGTRAVERVQLQREFEDPAVQARIEFLHENDYALVHVANEKIMKEYIGLDDSQQATSFLQGSDGQQYPTLYFQKTKPAVVLSTTLTEAAHTAA